jgi:hypothetical protein
MRNAAAGFVLGYLVIALLIAPPVLWATQATRSYGDGVVLVLTRTGVLGSMKNVIDQATEFRDRMLTELADYMNNTL